MVEMVSNDQFLEYIFYKFMENGLCKSEEQFSLFWLSRRSSFLQNKRNGHRKISLDPLLQISIRINIIVEKIIENECEFEQNGFQALTETKKYLDKFIRDQIAQSILDF